MACGVTAALCASANALTFNFNPAGGTPANVTQGFNAAAALWSAILTDSVTVNFDIAFATLGPGILGGASSDRATFTYSATRSALVTDATSGDDTATASALQSGSAFSLMINRTSDSPFGSGNATPYLDNDGDTNNTTIRMARSNAKALGLLAAADAARDADITFSDQFTWDFDRSDGITPGAFDFVGVAAHEIGHALGFTSGVDTLDGNSPPSGGPFPDSAFTWVSTLDLFRFSTVSRAQGVGVIDWTANTTDKFLSFDGGTTKSVSFATGTNFGDTQQASHFKDNLGIGIMDPTAAPGELLAISANDQRAFDVIGWNLSAAVGGAPEPAFLGLVGMMVLGVYATRRRMCLVTVRQPYSDLGFSLSNDPDNRYPFSLLDSRTY